MCRRDGVNNELAAFLEDKDEEYRSLVTEACVSEDARASASVDEADVIHGRGIGAA